MDTVKKYFKEELQCSMFGYKYAKPSDFYLSVWQKSESCLPLLILRSLLFLVSLGAILFSISLYIINNTINSWWIYLTHCGLIILVLTTGFSASISARVYFYGPISADANLPWDMKTFWVLYDISNPITYLITILYWNILHEVGLKKEWNHVLDIVVHGCNSVIMLLLMFSSSVKSRLLHFYPAAIFGLCWIIYSAIFYLAGGTNEEGNRYIYEVMDWSNPALTTAFAIMQIFALIVLHFATVGIALVRDELAKCVHPNYE